MPTSWGGKLRLRSWNLETGRPGPGQTHGARPTFEQGSEDHRDGLRSLPAPPWPPWQHGPCRARSRQRPHSGQWPPSRKRTFTFEFTQASSKCPVYYLSWALRPPLHSQRSQSQAQTEEESKILPAKPIFHMPSSPGELPSLGTQVRPRFPVTCGWALFSQANQDQFAKLLASGLLGDWRGQPGSALGDRPTWTHLRTIRTPARHAMLFTPLPSKLPLSSPLTGLLNCLKDFTAN